MDRIFHLKTLSLAGVSGLMIALLSCGRTVDPEKSDAYFLKKGSVYYVPGGNWFERGSKKMDADAETFRPLARAYGKDRHYIYFRASRQPGIDVTSFVIEQEIPRDKNNVYYYNGKDIDFNRNGEDMLLIVKNADPKSYQKLDKPYTAFTRDKQHYFYRNQAIDVDYASFHMLNPCFMKDTGFLYLDDGSTFQRLDISFKKAAMLTGRYICIDDHLLLYYRHYRNEGLIRQHISAESLPARVVDEDILKTKSSVYVFGKIIGNADPESFEVLFKTATELVAKDRNHVYCQDKEMDVPDVAGFRRAVRPGGKNIFFEDDLGNTYDRSVRKVQ